MLILSRKLGERVVVGSNVVVTVMEIRGDRVKIAFDAPSQMPIHREEVFHRIQSEEKERALQQQMDVSPYISEFA